MAKDLTARIKRGALDLGFDTVGVASPQPSRYAQALQLWLERGCHGQMEYLARDSERRCDPHRLMPEVRSVVVVGLNYCTVEPPEASKNPVGGRVSRYAWGEDYHRVIGIRLKALCRLIVELGGEGTKARYYVDTAPLLEKELAARAGIGWVGKHTNVVSTHYGSWLFLGVVLTSLELEFDSPMPDRCGNCTACLDACPTEAFTAPYQLDARRCISYLTIEHRGPIAPELREKMAAHVFGCDICLQVCPWNRHEKPQSPSPFEPRGIWLAPKLSELLPLTQEVFTAMTQHSAIRRAKAVGMVRNACIAAGNSCNKQLIPPLKSLLEHEDAAIRDCAAWALHRLEKIVQSNHDVPNNTDTINCEE